MLFLKFMHTSDPLCGQRGEQMPFCSCGFPCCAVEGFRLDPRASRTRAPTQETADRFRSSGPVVTTGTAPKNWYWAPTRRTAPLPFSFRYPRRLVLVNRKVTYGVSVLVVWYTVARTRLALRTIASTPSSRLSTTSSHCQFQSGNSGECGCRYLSRVLWGDRELRRRRSSGGL